MERFVPKSGNGSASGSEVDVSTSKVAAGQPKDNMAADTGDKNKTITQETPSLDVEPRMALDRSQALDEDTTNKAPENQGDESGKRIRGRPFQPGNSGRPPGSRNHATRLVEELLVGEGEALARKFIELALAGDARCLKAALDRLLPKRNGRAVDLNLPPIKTVADVAAAMTAVAAGISDGSISPEEANHIVGFLNSSEKVFEARDLIARLDDLEQRMPKK
jgi:hypothetical protein